MQTQKMYESREQKLELNPRKLFDIISMINDYCRSETEEFRDPATGDYGITYWRTSSENSLEILTEKRGSGEHRVQLADLVFDYDANKLVLRVHAHTNLLANPETLIRTMDPYKK